MEQYFGTLKTETIYLDGNRKSLPLSFVMQILEDYIEFYNNERKKKKFRLAFSGCIQGVSSLKNKKL